MKSIRLWLLSQMGILLRVFSNVIIVSIIGCAEISGSHIAEVNPSAAIAKEVQVEDTENRSSVMPVTSQLTLDLKNRSIFQRIDSEMKSPQDAKFVQIEVTEVLNLYTVPIMFNVHYQEPQKDRQLLGTFSLFPADNPGIFIVATRGKLRKTGVLSVTLVPLQAVKARQEIRLQLKPLTLIHD